MIKIKSEVTGEEIFAVDATLKFERIKKGECILLPLGGS